MAQVHLELQRAVWSTERRVGSDAPPECRSTAAGLASLWDYRSTLSQSHESALRDALLREVARHHHSTRADAPNVKAASALGWDDSFAAVMLAQQHNIAALMGATQVQPTPRRICLCVTHGLVVQSDSTLHA